MPFSSGVYTLPNPALVTGEVVSATENNTTRNDIAGAFNLTMLRNGTSTATANLPMGGYKLTGLGVATTSGDALSYGQAAVVSDITATGSITVNSGTVNGVAYLNGSKVLTTGSALTFDGSNFATTGSITSAGASNSGNLAFTGTGNRITGDFSNATLANRVLFQNSASNADTYLGIVPNGTSVASGLLSFNSSSPDNSGYGGFTIGSGSVTFLSGKIGTGTYLPMTFSTGGSERMRIDTSGNLGLGVTPSAWGSGSQALQNGSYSFSIYGVGRNLYYDGTSYKYVANANATSYQQFSGQHVWFTAPSGTAGNAISFTQAMTLDASGNLLVGQTAAGYQNSNGTSIQSQQIVQNHANGTSSGAYYLQFAYNASGIGSITQNGTNAVSYNTSSDYRLKENIQPMTGALDVVTKLKPVTYTWKADGSDGQGFIAHELQAVVPDCVTGEKDATRIEEYEITPAVPAVYEEVVIPAVLDEEGNVVEAERTEQQLVTAEVPAVMGEREVPVYQGIDTSFLVATLTKAIQELAAKVDAQQAEIDALKNAAA